MNRYEELKEYEKYVIDLYDDNNSIKLITDKLYKKVNTYLKARNIKTSGALWVYVPDLKYKKSEIAGFVYRTIYKYITEEKYKSKIGTFDFIPF